MDTQFIAKLYLFFVYVNWALVIYAVHRTKVSCSLLKVKYFLKTWLMMLFLVVKIY